MNRVIEQISRDERNHARITAPVVTQVKNEGIYMRKEIHRRCDCRTANFRSGEGVEFHIAHVFRENLELLEGASVALQFSLYAGFSSGIGTLSLRWGLERTVVDVQMPVMTDGAQILFQLFR